MQETLIQKEREDRIRILFHKSTSESLTQTDKDELMRLISVSTNTVEIIKKEDVI
jgi:hypothetical protein